MYRKIAKANNFEQYRRSALRDMWICIMSFCAEIIFN